MNNNTSHLTKLCIAISASVVLAACSTVAITPDGADNARSKLMLLQADPELATRAPIEIQDAELAVAAAENPERDVELGKHLVFVADHKVDIARFWAQSRLYEDQREALGQASEEARLQSRTREAERARNDAEIARLNSQRARNAADIARDQATAARTDTVIAQRQADSARNDTAIAQTEAANARVDANLARNQATASRLETEELARQILELNARDTDRGLVVTLGDVLFQTGRYAIQGGNTGNLDKLAMFLNHYEDRMVSIEGHTDNVGTAESNYSLSLSRANSVKDYLVAKGIVASRLKAIGQGENSPVSGNDTTTGRQQNRRVEVIIASNNSSLPLK